MNMLSLASVMACFAYFIIGHYVYMFNKKSRLSRMFLFLSLVFSIYAFAYAFYYVAPDKETAILWFKISSLGWTTFPVFLLLFVIALTGKSTKRRHWLLFPILFIPGFVFFHLAVDSHFFALDFRFNGYFWVFTTNHHSAVFWTYLSYLFIYLLVSILLIVHWRKKTRLNKEKYQANIILLSLALTFVLSFLSNVLFQVIKIADIPDIAHIFCLFMISGIAWALIKYRLMAISPTREANLIMAHMHEYLFFTNNDGLIIRSNNFTLRELKYTSKELYSKHIIELTNEDLISLEELNNDTKLNEERIRLNLKGSKQQTIPVSMTCTPVHDNFKDRIGFILVGYNTSHEDKLRHEIEERREVEYELIKAREKAEESDKLKSSFLANLSHELRTPLNGILGFTEILRMELNNADLIEIIDFIDQSGNRLLGTFNSLIDLSLIETDKNEIDKSIVNISELLAQKASLYKNYASSKNLFMNINVESPQLRARTDPRLLGHVLNNLIDNAIKYTESGGITISLQKESINRRDFLKITVADTGIGIDEQHFSRIFESFSQISEGFNREYEGIGIGLNICRKLIKLLDGEIWVKSKLSEGASFFVRIPSFQEKTTADNKAITTASESHGPGTLLARPFVLVIEDERTNQEYMKYILSEFYEVDIAMNGHKASELAKKNSYDIMFIAVNLTTDTLGLHSLKEIRKTQHHQHIPVAAITANTLKKQHQWILRHGFTHYLTKPFSRNQLLMLAQTMLADKHRGEQQD